MSSCALNKQALASVCCFLTQHSQGWNQVKMCRSYINGALNSYANSWQRGLAGTLHPLAVNNYPFQRKWHVFSIVTCVLDYTVVRALPNFSILEAIKMASIFMIIQPIFSHSPHIGLVIFHHCTLMFLFHLYYPHLPRILIVGLYPRAKHHSHSCDFISCAVTKTMGINFLRAEGYNSKGYLILSEYSWKKQSLNQGTDVGILCIIYRAVAYFLYAWDQPCPTQVC